MRTVLRNLLNLCLEPAGLHCDVEAALAGDDPVQLRRAGHALVVALIESGDLVQVQVSGRQGPLLYARPGHATLFDLEALADPADPQETPVPAESSRASVHAMTDPAPAPEPFSGKPAGKAAGDPDLNAPERLMQAMERAQALQASTEAGGGIPRVLRDILVMLEPDLPGLTLCLELFPPLEPDADLENVFAGRPGDRPFWAASRVPGEAFWIADERELPAPLRARLGGRTAGSVLAVPFLTPPNLDDAELEPSREAGLLYVLAPADQDRREMLRLGRRVARFVTHGWQQRSLMNRLVHTDPLTGVRNRAFFDTQFDFELDRARRRGSTVALLLTDIDHFKAINDQYGHPAGDRVLKAVARELLAGLRRIDLVCRVGGEEFALVLPDTLPAAVVEIVARLQVRIANLRLADPAAAEPIRLTVSCGGAVFPGAGETLDDLYRRADEMLYLSKQRGRNRCHLWNPDGEPTLSLPRYQAP
ncbi:MAG: GGDEF domain-containing protein [Candidatus Latescibacteria bacterium]|nr:GGDEF domain-containing protein [Candidatus Latescibacterota bacterium]